MFPGKKKRFEEQYKTIVVIGRYRRCFVNISQYLADDTGCLIWDASFVY